MAGFSSPASSLRNLRERYLSKGSFLAHVLTIMSGTTLAQALSVLMSPVLSRIYSPTAYGALAICTTLTMIPATIAALRYEQAIMLPAAEEDARQLSVLSLMLTGLTSLLCTLAIVLAGDWIVLKLNVPQLKPWLWLIPTGVLLVSTANILTQLQVRQQHYGLVSTARISQSVASVGAQFAAGLAGFGVGGLLTGAWLGNLVNVLFLIRRQLGALLERGGQSLAQLATQYRRFPAYSVPTALMDTASGQIPVLMLATFYSPQVAGLYALTDRVMRMPIGMIGSAVSQVFYQRLAQAKDDPIQARRLIVGTLRRLFLLGVGPAVLLAVFGKALFGLVFGAEWAAAGEMAMVLSISFLATFVSSPVSTFYNVYELQKLGMYFALASLIYRPLALYWGHLQGNVLHGLLMLAVLEVLQIVAYNVIGLRNVK